MRRDISKNILNHLSYEKPAVCRATRNRLHLIVTFVSHDTVISLDFDNYC